MAPPHETPSSIGAFDTLSYDVPTRIEFPGQIGPGSSGTPV
jgi:hypothetical protein